MKNVVDASAVLAVCNQEPGMVEARLKMRGGLISAVNLHEVFYKSLERNKLELAKAIVQTAGLRIVPFDEQQALVAAKIAIATVRKNVSLADRACLSLGMSQGLPILTGERKWGDLGLDVTIDVFRPESN